MEIGRRVRPILPKNVTGSGIALCVIGRRENRYAREFIAHYKALGFDKVFLCDNNRNGEERFDDVLSDYIGEGFVEVLNYRGMPGIQCTAYTDVYRRFGEKYRWMAFFDFDEYLEIVDGANVHGHDGRIHRLMRGYEEYDCVFFNWMNYGDNGLVRDDGRDLSERFTEPLPSIQYVQYKDIPENDHVKCVVRGGIKNLEFYLCPHLPGAPKLECCNSIGEYCEQKPYHKADYSVAYLKHYITKTIEEWVSIKWQKGAGTNASIEEFRSRYAGRFFKYNEWTPEKENVFRKLLGMPRFKPVKKHTVVIVNYNTQRLTECAIRSLNQHTPGCEIKVFDNSDMEAFVVGENMSNVEVIDNTKGAIINFDELIKSYPDRVFETNGSNFGSAKHCKTVDVCLDLFPEGFLLMDSDVLVKKDVSVFWDGSCAWSGLVNSSPSRWGIIVPRVLPFICYINAPMLKKKGIRYFNGEKMYALTSREPDKAYDTGAWFYEDCERHHLPGRYLMITDYIEHFDHGSWAGRDAEEWLEEKSSLWE